MKFYPELLQFADGKKVTAADWEKRRKEIIDILASEEYGYSPEAPEKVEAEVYKDPDSCCSGHARLERITLSFDTPKGKFSFPFVFFVPKEKSPLIIHINFRSNPYDKYCPSEEVIDNGFALASFCYKDITSDDGDFTNGLAAMFDRDEKTGWGKISMWAWAASRVIDYLVTRPEIDAENIAVAGHSRLGKTTLWCAAQDERVKFACVNGSGCSGAAYERIKHDGSEDVKAITRSFPYWFCGNYQKYIDKADEMPFDQHFAVAACAPRYVCVGDAGNDQWADQYSSQLSCVGASPAWKLLGKDGLIGPEEAANVGDSFGSGEIQYHLRDGNHYIGRTDWNYYMKFIKSKI